jgi:hypothetical protein
MTTKDANPEHHYVQAAVNALALEDKRPMRSIRKDVFAAVQRRRRVEWYYPR